MLFLPTPCPDCNGLTMEFVEHEPDDSYEARCRDCGCRSLGKKEMKWNDAAPKITVDPEKYEVQADGEVLTCEPAQILPLAQRYYLF